MKPSTDLTTTLQQMLEQCQPLYTQGKVADYIPALAQVDARQAAVAVATLDGQVFSAGAASPATTSRAWWPLARRRAAGRGWPAA